MGATGPQEFSVCPHDTANGVEKWAMFHSIIAAAAPCGSRYVPHFAFKDLDAALAEERVCWGYLNPAQFIGVRKKLGYVPIARPIERPDKAIFIRPVASPGARLEDFAGKRIAAAPGYLFALAKRELTTRGVAFTHVPARSYNEVVSQLDRGDADLGISYNEHFEALAERNSSRFVIIETIDPGLSHVVCAHPALPEDKRQALARFLLESPASPALQRALDAVGIKGFTAVDLAPFDALGAVLAAP